jgi:exosome complex RNA-binding protein Rrp42 (RNase PH superfamily)
VKQHRPHTQGAAISLEPFEDATCLWTDAFPVLKHGSSPIDNLRIATLRAHYLVRVHLVSSGDAIVSVRRACMMLQLSRKQVELVDLGFNVLSIRAETHFVADPYIEFKKELDTRLFFTTDTCRCVSALESAQAPPRTDTPTSPRSCPQPLSLALTLTPLHQRHARGGVRRRQG